MSVWRIEKNGFLYVLDKKGATERGKPYRLRIRHDGQHVEAPSFDTEDQARTYALRHQAKQKGQLPPEAVREPAKGRTTVRAYWERWWQAQSGLAVRTRQIRETTWRVHILPAIGDLPLKTVDRASINDLAQRWMKKDTGYQASTVLVGMRQSIHLMLRDAVIAGDHPGPNPCYRFKIAGTKSVDRAPDFALSRDEALAVVYAMPSHWAVLGQLAMETGMRQGELVGLQWPYIAIRPDRVIIKVHQQIDYYAEQQGPKRIDRQPRFKPPKNEKTRTVIAPAWFGPILEEHRNDRRHRNPWGLVFVNTQRNWITHQVMAETWKLGLAMLQRSPEVDGEQWRGWHQLRHHAASELLHRGVPLPVVAQQLGHTVRTLVSTYSHWIVDHSAEAVLLAAFDPEAPERPAPLLRAL